MISSVSYYLLMFLGFAFFIIFDYTLFIVIDYVAKIALKHTEWNKELIWGMESLILLTLGYTFQNFYCILQHTSYVLYTISICEIFAILFSAKIYFRTFVMWLFHRWDEYQQHEECRENQQRLIEATKHLSNQSTGMMTTMTPQHTNQLHSSFSADSLIANQQRSQYEVTCSNYFLQNNPNLHRQTNSNLYNRFSQSNDRSLTNRLFSFVGPTNKHEYPPGLKNPKNTCFLNCILQILAHSPKFVEGFLCMNDNTITELLKNSKEIFLQLHYNRNNKPYYDTERLRNAIISRSGNNDQFFSETYTTQEQQDAHEFLLWYLENLHQDILSTNSIPFYRINGPLTGRPPQNSLEFLRYVYGDMSPKDIEEAKQSCNLEIQRSPNTEIDTFIEAVQRLSDVEWLEYKTKNTSPIDDLFTGQQLFIAQCTKCYRPSVKIQNFRVLMLPIINCESRSVSGLLTLDDCFHRFAASENISNSVACKFCRSSPNGGNGINKVQTYRRILPTDEMEIASPILPSKSSPTSESPLPSFKTSTPVHGLSLDDTNFDMQIQVFLRHPPPYIAIQLLRYRFLTEENLCEKINTPIAIPVRNLNLAKVILGNNLMSNKGDMPFSNSMDFVYDLYAICLHYGNSSNDGHYLAYTLGHDDLWYKFDDKVVTRVNSMEYELTKRQIRENAYLLFYKRRNC